MKIIDSHCHLDGFFEDGTLGDVLARAQDALIDKMVVVGTSYKDWEIQSKLVDDHDNLFYTVGLHPLYAEDKTEIEKIDEFFVGSKKPIAVGEIGLDYHKMDISSEEGSAKVKQQHKIFAKQLAIAREKNLPVIIHSRDAFDDTLSEISKAKIEPSRVVFHCFGYGVEEVDVLNKLGYYISFSGTSTFKRFDIETIKHANLDKLLIETDCPFLAPASHRGQKNEPSFLREIATFDANILGMPEKDFCELTYNNTIRFYGIGK